MGPFERAYTAAAQATKNATAVRLVHPLPFVDEKGVPTNTQIGPQAPAGAVVLVYPHTSGLAPFDPQIANIAVQGAHTVHPIFARRVDLKRSGGSRGGFASIGQATAGSELVPAVQAQAGAPAATDAGGFLSTVPMLLLVGIVTGGAFAIGAGLVERYVFPRK